jgi:RecJ-like exonuclease
MNKCKCGTCNGRGLISEGEKCPDCKGYGNMALLTIPEHVELEKLAGMGGSYERLLQTQRAITRLSDEFGEGT